MSAIFRSDNLHGTKFGGDLYSVRYAQDIENGSILLLGDLEEGQREVYEGLVPASDSPIEKLVVIGSEEVNKASTAAADFLNTFVNKAESEMRGYALKGVYSVTKDGFNGGASAAVGNLVYVDGSTKATIGATASGVTIGEVIAIEGDYVVVRCAG